ncbi:hypothetical protein FSP39_014038 [Pinctada imbricata]|uniref:TMEM248/TMEM219 domain-containing protein n=1 Tax=Pinctada imbricata TaxID=66713 RepID=A0AA89BME1_PINIB|nr:hypothetical protein FSP39_014038 [Pinctada imbricata]
MLNTICENLQGFAKSRPPLVIFMVCLGGFAVVLLTLAYVIKLRENLPNPDLTQDWNTFLDDFDDLNFCILGNSSESDLLLQKTAPRLKHVISDLPDKLTGESKSTTQKPATDNTGEEYMNTSVSMLVHITPTPQFLSMSHNTTYLYATVNGSQMGLSDPAAGLEMNISMVIPFEWNTTQCPSGQCRTVQIYTCITFSAPYAFFPGTRQPGTCRSIKDSDVVEYRSRMIAHPAEGLPSCGYKAKLQLQHHLDPQLTMLLSIEDRSLINLHLMHTSYFLFVMFVTVFCYALIKGKAKGYKVKQPNYSEVRS